MATKFNKDQESLYTYNATSTEKCHATPGMKHDFDENGYVIVQNLFSKNEISKLMKGMMGAKELWEGKFGLTDKENRTYSMLYWLEVGEDILGMTLRTQKLSGVAEELLDKGELYMYSGKVILKQEKTGGALIWHQDYGYWYNNRCLFPDFITCFIALTKNDHENGGLQVIKGSHKCGRLEHGPQAGQTGADEERVEMIKQVLPVVDCDLTPGDVIFFHANTLHSSKANDSEFKRWNMIFSLNAKHNSPDRHHYNNQYTESSKIHKVGEDAMEKLEDLHVNSRKYWDPTTNNNIRIKEGYLPQH